MEARTGYKVEYSEKKGFFDGYGETQTILCSQKYLAEMLSQKPRCCIWSAVLVNVPDYQGQLEERGF